MKRRGGGAPGCLVLFRLLSLDLWLGSMGCPSALGLWCFDCGRYVVGSAV